MPDPARVLGVGAVPVPPTAGVCPESLVAGCVSENPGDVTGPVTVGPVLATESLSDATGGLDSAGTLVVWAGPEMLDTSCCKSDPGAGVVTRISA